MTATSLLSRERDFQEAVRQLFRRYGWWVRHTWDSRHTEKGDSDIMAIKAGRLVFAELKIDKTDYAFMLAHRPPADASTDHNRIASNGYFCARLAMQRSGEALRILHAGLKVVPQGTIILCPHGRGGVAQT